MENSEKSIDGNQIVLRREFAPESGDGDGIKVNALAFSCVNNEIECWECTVVLLIEVLCRCVGGRGDGGGEEEGRRADGVEETRNRRRKTKPKPKPEIRFNRPKMVGSFT